MRKYRTAILISLSIFILSSCSHQKSIFGEYICKDNYGLNYLKLNADSTFICYYKDKVLCGGIYLYPPPTPSYYKYFIRSDSFILAYGPSEPYDVVYPERCELIETLEGGLMMPTSMSFDICIRVPMESFPAKILFIHRGTIYEKKEGTHFLNKYSKVSGP